MFLPEEFCSNKLKNLGFKVLSYSWSGTSCNILAFDKILLQRLYDNETLEDNEDEFLHCYHNGSVRIS